MKKHIYYFDHLRLLAAISVIYMHTSAAPLRITINSSWHGINALTSFGFTAVPLFFMMSGYLLLRDPRTTEPGLLIKKRLPRLIVPLIGWSVVAILWKMISSGQYSVLFFADNLFGCLRTPAWIHFWYIYTLIALYMISPILAAGMQALGKSGHRYVLFIVGAINLYAVLKTVLPDPLATQIQMDWVDQLTLFNGHISAFVLGYYLGAFEKKIPNSILILTALGLLAVISVGTWYLSMQTGAFNQTYQNQAAGFEVLLAAVVFLFFKQNLDRPVRFWGGASAVPLLMGVYFMHGILLSMVGIFYTAQTLAETWLVTAVIFTVCLFVMKTAATIKPICYLATGLSYEAACRTCNWIYTARRIKQHRQNRQK